MDIERELKEKLLKLFEETDRQSDEQEAYIQELRQRLSLAEKVCFEANGYLKSKDNPLGKISLERLEESVKKWDNGRPNKGAQYVVWRIGNKIKSKDREGERSMSRATDYSTGYADGKRAGLLGVSRCMHMMIDTQRCTSLRYFRGFEAGFRDGLAAIGLEPEVSRRRA